MKGIARSAWLLAAIAIGASGCDPPPSSAAPETVEAPDPLAPLRAFEEARRAETDFAHLPGWDQRTGPNPFAVAALPGKDARFVGLLRGDSAIVLLDADAHEKARLAAPGSPTGLAVAADGAIFVVGEASGSIARYRSDGEALTAHGTIELEGARSLRSVALGPEGVLYAVSQHDGRLLTAPQRGGPSIEGPRCHGPIQVARAGAFVVVDCLLDHTLVVYPVDARGVPDPARPTRITHDGPIWSFDAAAYEGGLLIAAGGVEDHPLDRTEGSFGFIDSFVFLIRVDASGVAKRLAETNVSELSVITPKLVDLEVDRSGAARVEVTGYGGDRKATLVFPADPAGEITRAATALPAGTVAKADSGDVTIFASPLLDAWVVRRGSAVSIVSAAERDERAIETKVGEALFFTNLMAPWNHTEGRLSRFTCETCHFEGYVDGRTHHTGRGDIRATTKPLVGLFNNRPYFSRALDPDLSAMVDAEFRVAGAKSDHDPVFSLGASSRPVLAALGAAGELDPMALRRSLMAFLMVNNHRPNPMVAGETKFSSEARRGAELFRDRCEGCHEARLVSDDPSSRVPFGAWEGSVLSPSGPIVWGKDAYEKTGVEPYVYDAGARVPSLRRLYAKSPYFTNGSARDLDDVLASARFRGSDFLHESGDASGPLERLDEAERAALLSFLDRL